MREAGFGVGVDAIRFGAREQRCALVDLIKRVGYYDSCARPAGIDDGLREREQSLAAAQHRQYLSRRIERRRMMSCPKPTPDRLAQRDCTNCRGIMRESRRRARSERIEHEPRGRMARLTDRQVDRRLFRIRNDRRHKRAQPLERVRL